MLMTCAIMQPTYLPWLGYFDLIRSVDVFVISVHVQFEKQSWQQRNRIRDKSGEIMLTVPVLSGDGFSKRIMDVNIDYSRQMLNKHLRIIQQVYAKSKNFKLIFPDIEAIYSKKPERLMDLNVDLIHLGMKYLGIDTRIVFSSELDVQGKRVESLIDMCGKLNCSTYLSPIGSKVYIDENNLFPENNIELIYQQYTPPVYPQVNCENFISHLAFIDYLFNIDLDVALMFGKETSLKR